MRKTRRTALSLLLGLVVTGNLVAEEAGIESVDLRVVGPGGTAFIHIEMNGERFGGSFSAGERPFVNEARDRVPVAELADLVQAAQSVVRRADQLAPTGGIAWASYHQIEIRLASGHALRFAWPLNEEHHDPAVRELGVILFRLRLGGW